MERWIGTSGAVGADGEAGVNLWMEARRECRSVLRRAGACCFYSVS